MNNPLQFLVDIPNVTDILVNGPRDVWVDRGNGMEIVELMPGFLETNEDVRDLAFQLAAMGGHRLDDACPIVDSQLNDGIRIHAVLSPIINQESGAVISLRIPAKSRLKIEDMFEKVEGYPPEICELLHQLVAASANIIITGGTGSGKTTLMSALISLAAETQRIVCIEEVKELANIDHPHLVNLYARQANIEGKGKVTLEELVRATMRMRPDRIMLGECRGAEIKELFTALNTGHKGGICTLHANSVKSVPARLEALFALGGLNSETCAKQAIVVDVLLHMAYTPRGRVLQEVGVLELSANGQLSANTLFSYSDNGKIWRSEKWEEFCSSYQKG